MAGIALEAKVILLSKKVAEQDKEIKQLQKQLRQLIGEWNKFNSQLQRANRRPRL